MSAKPGLAETLAVRPATQGDVTTSPLPVHERIQALDVLRGVAVFGILLANVMVFFGLTFARQIASPL